MEMLTRVKKFPSLSSIGAAVIFVLTQCGAFAEANAASAALWQEEWSKTIAAAEKEGQIVLYANEGVEGSVHEFQKKFPKIKIVKVA